MPLNTGTRTLLSDLGAFLQNAGRQNEAEEALRLAVAQGHEMAMYNLGVTLAARGNTREAQDCYRKAAAAGNVMAANNLGQILEQDGDDDGAIEWFTRAAQGGNPKAAYNLGLQYQKNDDLAKATDWYREPPPAAIRTEPTISRSSLITKGLRLRLRVSIGRPPKPGTLERPTISECCCWTAAIARKA